MMRTLSALASIPILLTFGCAGDEPVSDDAAKGWRATQLAVGEGQASWQQEVDVDGSLDVSLECPDGGSYQAIGSYADDSSFELSIEFDGCEADGVVIDGSLSMSALVEVTENGARVETSYKGELAWSGEASGSCEIDASAFVSVDRDEVEAEFHGEICGFSADAVVHASAE